MSGIPGGGFIGEMVIVTMYGLPLEALPIISAIGVVVDSTTPKHINLIIKKDIEADMYEWLNSLAITVKDTLYDYVVSTNKKLLDKNYLLKKSGLAITSRRAYKLKLTVPTYESALKLLNAANKTFDDYANYLCGQGINCTAKELEVALFDYRNTKLAHLS